jgi:hypothetical protein
MTDPATIFQRTHTGREEIQKKSHGLTQSERLVLIMIDGVSSYKEIRAKLPVLTDERFERALQKLQLKELALEVFMPLEGQAPDELERTVIDRFLQQDPMDPLTVILLDPEDELGTLSLSQQPSAPLQPVLAEATVALPNIEEEPPAPAPSTAASTTFSADDFPTLSTFSPTETGTTRAESALDAQDVLTADALSAELKAKWASRMPSPPICFEPTATHGSNAVCAVDEVSPFVAVHWGYWCIVSGLSFIVGFVLARVTS